MSAHFEVDVKETYVVKTPTPLFLSTWNLDEWVNVVNSLSHIPAIQPISLEDGKVIQPLAPGRELASIGMSVDDEPVLSQINRTRADIRSLGYNLENIHHGNVFYDSETGQITIVDLGQLSKVDDENLLNDDFCST